MEIVTMHTFFPLEFFVDEREEKKRKEEIYYSASKK